MAIEPAGFVSTGRSNRCANRDMRTRPTTLEGGRNALLPAPTAAGSACQLPLIRVTTLGGSASGAANRQSQPGWHGVIKRICSSPRCLRPRNTSPAGSGPQLYSGRKKQCAIPRAVCERYWPGCVTHSRGRSGAAAGICHESRGCIAWSAHRYGADRRAGLSGWRPGYATAA